MNQLLCPCRLAGLTSPAFLAHADELYIRLEWLLLHRKPAFTDQLRDGEAAL